MKKVIYLLVIFILSFNLFGYELPKIEISDEKSKPEIVFFTAENILVNEKQSYILKWKTLNTTKVTMTYLGDMELSGSTTVTSEEFNHGAITLKAYSNKSKYVDKITLNGNEEVFDETNPVPKNISNKTPAFYDSVPMYYNTPYRRYPRTHPANYRRHR